MKKGLILLLAVVFVAASAGCGSDSKKDDKHIILTTGFENDELFFIGDSKCYVPEARLYIRNLATGYETLYGDEIMNRMIGGATVSDKLSSLALSRLAEVKVMGLLAADLGITLDDRDTEKCTQAADRYIQSLTDGDIADIGIDYDLLLSMYKDYALADKVYDSVTGDINPEISDDEARIITIQRILIKGDNESEAMQTANTIYAMINEGMSFDSLVDDYNEAPQSKYSFGKDSSDFSPEFIDACFELSTDEISGPVITEEGVSIVKCLSSYDMEQTDINKVRMVEKRKSDAFNDVYSAFVKDLYSDFNSDLWDEQMLTSRKLDTKDNFFEVYDDIFNTPGTESPGR
ncbi:MAG: peptidylprolyl isomerase [Lachnospiraceae bacterium]|nr:peptidylprolyl isomerase [Lachnospiraceae bacterium]